MLFVPEVFGDGANLHALSAHLAHLAHDVRRQQGFVVSLALRLAAVLNGVRMVFRRSHPLKVFDAVVPLVKVLVVDGVSRYAHWSGRLSKKSQSNKLVNARHPLHTLALKQNKPIAFDHYWAKFSAAYAAPVRQSPWKAPYAAVITDLVIAVKRMAGNRLPIRHMQLSHIAVFPGEEALLTILERNGIPLP